MKRAHGGASDRSVLDFSSNVNPLGPPESVLKVLEGGANLIARYPSPGADDFCAAIGEYFEIPRANVLAGNGASDLIYLITRLFAGKCAQVLTPAFTEYEDALEAAGIPVNEGEPGVTFLANPSSPEGRLTPASEILRRPGPLVVDESFMDFAGERESLLARAATDSRLIVLRSMTKFYAMPGLRLGYLISSTETVARLRRLQPPWSVNALAAAAGIAALADRDYARRTLELVPKLRADLACGLGNLGLHPLPSEANFILCRVPDAALICRELLGCGIAARNCDSFTGLEKNRYVRFAVRVAADNERLLSALKGIQRECLINR